MSRVSDYKDMRQIKSASQVTWPSGTPSENFYFQTTDNDGDFLFKFKWLNDRWACWVTLPDGTTREAGVFPNVVSWSGYLDYGLIFNTELTNINFDQLFMTELLILKWQ